MAQVKEAFAQTDVKIVPSFSVVQVEDAAGEETAAAQTASAIQKAFSKSMASEVVRVDLGTSSCRR